MTRWHEHTHLSLSSLSLYLSISLSIYICVYVCVYMYIYICLCVCTYNRGKKISFEYILNKRWQAHYLSIYQSIYVCMRVCIFKSVYVCIWLLKINSLVILPKNWWFEKNIEMFWESQKKNFRNEICLLTYRMIMYNTEWIPCMFFCFGVFLLFVKQKILRYLPYITFDINSWLINFLKNHTSSLIIFTMFAALDFTKIWWQHVPWYNSKQLTPSFPPDFFWYSFIPRDTSGCFCFRIEKRPKSKFE